METKRKKTVVTMLTRLEAISRIDLGEPLRKIAAEYNVGTSTVSDWKKNRKDIENFCANMISKECLANRVTAKQANDKWLDLSLYEWYVQERTKNLHISGPDLQAKALELNKELNGNPTFCASAGWLTRWKARHGISSQQNHRSTKSLGDVTSSKTSSFTTTSATTTSCTTSSITTTSLTTVSVTTTFSTVTTPSTSIFSSVYLPNTSGFDTSFIKEEMDLVGPDEINSEPDHDDFAELENTDQLNQFSNKGKDNEVEGNSSEEGESEEREEEVLSDILHTTDSFDSKLHNILTDNIFKFCDINPTFSQIPTQIPSPRHSSEPQSTVKLKYLELEQKLRVYYLKTMIKKEEELMNIKIQLYKAQLIREKAEAENNRITNTLRLDNLNIENKMLNLRLQIMVK